MSCPEHTTKLTKLQILAPNMRLIPQQRRYVALIVVTPDAYQIHTMNFIVSYSSVLKEGMIQFAGDPKINGANWVGGGEI